MTFFGSNARGPDLQRKSRRDALPTRLTEANRSRGETLKRRKFSIWLLWNSDLRGSARARHRFLKGFVALLRTMAIEETLYTRRIRAMGIRDHPIAPRSPWQNGHVERLIGSIRRESLDHLVVFGEAHLRDVLKNYASYYNQIRPHRSLDKDAPDFRRTQKIGRIAAIPILGGLHHQYVRV